VKAVGRSVAFAALLLRRIQVEKKKKVWRLRLSRLAQRRAAFFGAMGAWIPTQLTQGGIVTHWWTKAHDAQVEWRRRHAHGNEGAKRAVLVGN